MITPYISNKGDSDAMRVPARPVRGCGGDQLAAVQGVRVLIANLAARLA
jgi:hypothetical protein